MVSRMTARLFIHGSVETSAAKRRMGRGIQVRNIGEAEGLRGFNRPGLVNEYERPQIRREEPHWVKPLK